MLVLASFFIAGLLTRRSVVTIGHIFIAAPIPTCARPFWPQHDKPWRQLYLHAAPNPCIVHCQCHVRRRDFPGRGSALDSPSDHPWQFGRSRTRFPSSCCHRTDHNFTLCAWTWSKSRCPKAEAARQPPEPEPESFRGPKEKAGGAESSVSLEALLTVPDSTSIPPTSRGRIGGASGGPNPRPPILHAPPLASLAFCLVTNRTNWFLQKTLPPQSRPASHHTYTIPHITHKHARSAPSDESIVDVRLGSPV